MELTRRAAPVEPAATTHSRRWLALAFIALAQLMVVLDVTIVNIALPSAQRALGASDAAANPVTPMRNVRLRPV